jgi:hypothetical protein
MSREIVNIQVSLYSHLYVIVVLTYNSVDLGRAGESLCMLVVWVQGCS